MRILGIKDVQERSRSSSGGVFWAIADNIIKNGGIVIGASFDENLRLNHEYTLDNTGLESMRGSKYLQSNMGVSIYSKIRDCLNKNQLVYFSGTPCQVAGIRSAINDTKGLLLTSDLVCHGVPSQRMFDEHIKWLKHKYNAKSIDRYQFRDPKNWGGCEIVNYTDSFGRNKERRKFSYELSPYLYSFISGMTYRDSCYTCPYSKVERVGDITLGDHWGVEHLYPEMDTSKGVSLVLVNSEKGRIFLNGISGLELKESILDFAINNNDNLKHPAKKPAVRNFIYKELQQNGYDYIAKKYFRSPRRCRVVIFHYLRNILGDKHVKFLKKNYRSIKQIISK